MEFKTQEDEDGDASSSKDARELVLAAQTIFQMGGADCLHNITLVTSCVHTVHLGASQHVACCSNHVAHQRVANGVCGVAGAGGSVYVPIVVLFPVLAPLVQIVAGTFPDAGLKKVLRDAEHT